MTTRRQFLSGCTRTLAAAGLISTIDAHATNAARGEGSSQDTPITFYDIKRPPDVVTAFLGSGPSSLEQNGPDVWEHEDVIVKTETVNAGVNVTLDATNSAVNRIKLRWHFRVFEGGIFLGDAWERAYGDLEWRGMDADRVMPWYFANSDAQTTHCYGVSTGPTALCFWQIDPDGITLWADVRSGGSPVTLGGRVLQVCTVVSREGIKGESSHDALHDFCKSMCPKPRLPKTPIIGCNDWYYTYGNNSADQTRRDAKTLVSLTSGTNIVPFACIDGGWQFGGGGDGGDWSKGTDKFPDMPGIAADIVQIGALPGIWFRPLYAVQSTPDTMRSVHTNALDPTAPGVLAKVHDDVARFRSWGIELIKHDFTTFDITGRWGFQMGPSPTDDGWQFAEGTSRTTAEVVSDLYGTIRVAAGDALVNGCNTLSHLAAGVFEIARIGDDNSGHQWARTRKMGLNSLAFRACQHGAFYAVDPDCVGITNQIPWTENRQMLDLVSRSGAVTFVSLSPDAAAPNVLDDIRSSFAQVAANHKTGKAADWQKTISPHVGIQRNNAGIRLVRKRRKRSFREYLKLLRSSFAFFVCQR